MNDLAWEWVPAVLRAGLWMAVAAVVVAARSGDCDAGQWRRIWLTWPKGAIF